MIYTINQMSVLIFKHVKKKKKLSNTFQLWMFNQKTNSILSAVIEMCTDTVHTSL